MQTQQRYAVYHANDLLAMVLPHASHWYKDQFRSYTHVADVVAPLEHVFALTNSIDHPWTINPEIVWHITTTPLRSTSAGDVIVSYTSGQAWLVLPIGLQELPPDNGTPTGDDGTSDAYRTTQQNTHSNDRG